MTAVATRAQAALALRLAGARYEDIIETVGYKDVQTCRADVNKLLAQDVPGDERRHYRERASRRLESLLDAIWDKAHNPAHAEQLPAVRAARELLRELIQLHGAAAPQEVIVHNPGTEQLMTWFREHGMIERPDVGEVNPFAMDGDVEDAEVIDD